MTVKQIAQLPPIGVANRFSANAKDWVPTRELTLTLDSDTGLLSLGNTFTSRELRHSHKWLKYQEPESHCLTLGEEMLRLVTIPDGIGIAGLSWKDSGLMNSFARCGHNTIIVYPRAPQKGSSLELDAWERDSIDVQELVSSDGYSAMDPRFGFLSARHILEHATSIENFMAGLAKRVRPNGYVLLEVPDCEEAIATCDYSMIWEEHIHYFTADSLERSLEKMGWRMIKISREIVEEEAVLIAIVQPPLSTSMRVPKTESHRSNPDALHFGVSFEECRLRVMTFLLKKARSGGCLYLLGANHVASNFIDLFGETDLFSGCIDDKPEKQGKYLSGLNVPIVSRDSLILGKDDYVISAINLGRTEAVEKKLVDAFGSQVVINRVRNVMRVNEEQ